jgi:hypothetical protein
MHEEMEMSELLEFGGVVATTRHDDSFGPFVDPIFENCTCHPDDPFDPSCPPCPGDEEEEH